MHITVSNSEREVPLECLHAAAKPQFSSILEWWHKHDAECVWLSGPELRHTRSGQCYVSLA